MKFPRQIIKSHIRLKHISEITTDDLKAYKTNKLIAGITEESPVPLNYDYKSKIVTIFGNTGFLGKYVVEYLTKLGYQIILPYRGDFHDIKSVRMIGTYGQSLFKPFSVDDISSIEDCLKYSQIAINLLGRDFENSHYSFNEIHVDVPGRIANIAKRIGVQSFIHLSTLGATERPPALLSKDGSKFISSKYKGEKAVLNEFPEAVIVRPATMWGYHDRFIFNLIHKERRLWSSRNSAHIRLYNKGENIFKQPVYVGDVGLVISRLVQLLVADSSEWPSQNRNIVELAGPDRYQLNHLASWFFYNLRFRTDRVHISPLTNRYILQKKLLEKLYPIFPHVTFDSLEKESTSEPPPSKSSILFDDFNIRPCKFEHRIQWLLKPYRGLGYSWDDLGGFEPPPLPPHAVA